MDLTGRLTAWLFLVGALAVIAYGGRASGGKPPKNAVYHWNLAIGGTVQFKDGAANLGAPVALVGGSAALSTSSLTDGSHSITAVYSGDIDDATSTSPAISQVVSVVVPAAAQAIPTLSEWMLVLLAAMVAGLGLMMRRRP